jgi:hypothetical protein
MESSHYQLHLDRVKTDEKLRMNYLSCGICKNILWEPEKCEYCKTHFCRFCITFSLLKSKNCPSCVNEYKRGNSDYFLLEDLKDIIINCNYAFNGCTKAINYDQIKSHEDECIYKEKDCEECNTKVLKKYYHTHIIICKNNVSNDLLIDCKQIITYYQEKLNKLERENLLDIENLKKSYSEAFNQKEDTINKLLKTIQRQHQVLEEICKGKEKLVYQTEENSKIGNKINCNFI